MSQFTLKEHTMQLLAYTLQKACLEYVRENGILLLLLLERRQGQGCVTHWEPCACRSPPAHRPLPHPATEKKGGTA